MVAQQRELHRLAAAVGDAADAQRVGLGDALVGEHAQQVLGVADLVALVGEMRPAPLAPRRGGIRAAAGVAEPARRVGHDREAQLREVDVVVVEGRPSVAIAGAGLEGGLALAPAVQEDDRGEGAVAAGGKGHVGVQRRAVPAGHPGGGAGSGAEERSVLRRAGVPEGQRRGRRSGGGQSEGGGGRERGRQGPAMHGGSLPRGQVRPYLSAAAARRRRRWVQPQAPPTSTITAMATAAPADAKRCSAPLPIT